MKVPTPTPALRPKSEPPPLPKWASALGKKWNSGAYSVVVVSGNIFDLYPVQTPDEKVDYVQLRGFLFSRQFKNCKAFMSYDIGNGLRFATPEMKSDFYEWLRNFDDVEGTSFHSSGLPTEFHKLSVVLRRYFKACNDRTENTDRHGITIVIDFPEKIIPASENANASFEERAAAVALSTWASSEELRKMSVSIFLVTESAGNLNRDILQNPNVAQVVIDMPDEKERLAFISSDEVSTELESKKWQDLSVVDVKSLSSRTAGLNLVRINGLIMEAVRNNEKISPEFIAVRKKKLIEEFCGGLVKFKEPNPKLSLDCVATHEKAKKKLRDMARLFKEGHGSVLEKGVLIPGRVGVGKSFLVDCFASECGLPVMELGNFRSKWVGDTEQQLDRILMTVKALGPVVVVVDEIDAVMGNRNASGDSGVSSRVFAALAAHIGDSSLRGRELWIGMTSRPDLMAIDMKRQGRFGLCLPLFPTSSKEETTEMFKVVAKIDQLTLDEEVLSTILECFPEGGITGSDAESILKRAVESSLLDGRDKPQGKDFKEVISNFINPLDEKLLRLQDLAAILATSDKRFLPVNPSKGGIEESIEDARTEFRQLLFLLDKNAN